MKCAARSYIDTSVLSTFGKIFRRRHIGIFFLIFTSKQVLTFYTNLRKMSNLVCWGKTKKNINSLSAELIQRMVRVED